MGGSQKQRAKLFSENFDIVHSASVLQASGLKKGVIRNSLHVV